MIIIIGQTKVVERTNTESVFVKKTIIFDKIISLNEQKYQRKPLTTINIISMFTTVL